MKNSEHRLFVLQIALKCADISNPCRTWDISKKWSMKVCEEFFRQGDYERKLNLPITALCDRHNTSIPRIQTGKILLMLFSLKRFMALLNFTGFLKFVVTPLMTEWHRFLQSDLSNQMMNNLKYNQNKWDMLVIKENAEENPTEIIDAVTNDDDITENISNSAELLLPDPVPPPLPNQANKSSEAFNAFRRRFSVPAAFKSGPEKANLRRESLPAVYKKISNSNLLVVEEDEHSLKDSEFSFRTEWSDKGDNKNNVISAQNLISEHSIVSMTSCLEATRLNFILHGTGTSKILQRQQTFPPVQPFNRMRYLSAAGEMPSCVEALTENSSPSESSSTDSSPDVTKTLIDKTEPKEMPVASASFKNENNKTDYDAEANNSKQSLKQGSSESLVVMKHDKDIKPIIESDKNVGVTILKTVNESSEDNTNTEGKTSYSFYSFSSIRGI